MSLLILTLVVAGLGAAVGLRRVERRRMSEMLLRRRLEQIRREAEQEAAALLTGG